MAAFHKFENLHLTGWVNFQPPEKKNIQMKLKKKKQTLKIKEEKTSKLQRSNIYFKAARKSYYHQAKCKISVSQIGQIGHFWIDSCCQLSLLKTTLACCVCFVNHFAHQHSTIKIIIHVSCLNDGMRQTALCHRYKFKLLWKIHPWTSWSGCGKMCPILIFWQCNLPWWRFSCEGTMLHA